MDEDALIDEVEKRVLAWINNKMENECALSQIGDLIIQYRREKK